LSKINTSRDLVLRMLRPTWGTACHRKTITSLANPCTEFDNNFYLQPFKRNLGGVKFWNWSCNPVHGLSEMVGRPKDNAWACKHTKFDDSSFSRSRDILAGVKF